MKKRNSILIIVIILLLVSLFAVSYAYFQVTKTQTTANVAKSKCFSTSFSGTGVVSLSGAFPISDDVGKVNTNKYTFTITNTCDMKVAYDVNLEVLSTSSADFHNYIKAMIGTDTPKLLTGYAAGTKTITGTPYATYSYKLKTGTLNPTGSSGNSVTYDLRLWVDYATTPTQGNNKTLESKITVISSATK